MNHVSVVLDRRFILLGGQARMRASSVRISSSSEVWSPECVDGLFREAGMQDPT
ncbi:MAG: hypothetical protein AVDCRST_MAG05-516 [uncultured Rubrobacteraceae bacterium]|uniref:Uncharacterized protein n=1 Tax=uncultured Rubrobacteraceae bacterium TaxID=349277 RepID=A0A6J4RCT8_9ACTN|nr:MAG: hypothetical protein AVDCRST_MAG05-516 [uncultured Rubrobacteraceae bacterium]